VVIAKNYLFFFIFILSFSSLLADEYLRHTANNKIGSIDIYSVDNLHMNKLCSEEINKCLLYLRAAKGNTKRQLNPEHSPNLASDFCKKAGGHSEIFSDRKNSQYDFCVFKNGYIIDSWEYFQRFGN
jgi:putative hemolysin